MGKTKYRLNSCLGLVGMVTLALPSDAVKPPAEVAEIVLEMEKAVKRTNSSECIFRKEVRPKKKLQPQEQIQLKSNQTGDVYMKWVGKVHTGREVLFRPNHYSSKLIYKSLINLRLDPAGKIAMLGNRHSIKEAGLLWTSKRILKDARYVDNHPDSAQSYQFLGNRTVHGVASQCFISETPLSRYKGFYIDKSEICLSEKTKLPTMIKNWEVQNNALVLVEVFSWEQCKFNHLRDADFDIDNPNYGF